MMKRPFTLASLAYNLLTLLFIAGCTMQGVAQDQSAAVAFNHSPVMAVSDETGDNISMATEENACVAPLLEHQMRCREVEANILAATVRLELHGPNGGMGHGTVINGRYLITHNHYAIDGAALKSGQANGVTAVSVFKATGEIVLLKAPLSYFTVAAVSPGMLVLDFKVYGGTGFFDSVGISSAEFKAWDSLALEPGTEVAQADWDGNVAHVDWVRVNAIRQEHGTPVLELDSFVQQGASGGGVFYDGYHFANNWFRSTGETATGDVVQRVTVAALNSSASLLSVEAPAALATVNPVHW